MTDAVAYVREVSEPEVPAPTLSQDALAWARANLFSSAPSALTTLAFVALALWLVPPLVAWATTNAVWSAPDGALCRAHQDGACWAFIGAKLDYLRFGSYPIAERWRVSLALGLGAVLLVWLLAPRAPRKALAALLFFAVFPIVAFFLLHGAGALGLPVVDTILWGGLMVTLVAAAVSIVFSLPLGVMLALGRRSQLPVVRLASVMFIEFMRGVPFITVLFMANAMLPLFLPEGWTPDRLVRPLFGMVMFAAAYLAEEVRGGLQALRRGQYEAAEALGLRYWLKMGLVILPQALTLVIPGIVNSYVGLFLDTTLVAIVGMTDFLEAMNNAFKDPVWAGPTIGPTGYVFAGLVYFAFCYGMTRYSAYVERTLAKGRRQ